MVSESAPWAKMWWVQKAWQSSWHLHNGWLLLAWSVPTTKGQAVCPSWNCLCVCNASLHWKQQRPAGSAIHINANQNILIFPRKALDFHILCWNCHFRKQNLKCSSISSTEMISWPAYNVCQPLVKGSNSFKGISLENLHYGVSALKLSNHLAQQSIKQTSSQPSEKRWTWLGLVHIRLRTQ